MKKYLFTLCYTMDELVTPIDTFTKSTDDEPNDHFEYQFTAKDMEEAIEIANAYLDGLADYAGICENKGLYQNRSKYIGDDPPTWNDYLKACCPEHNENDFLAWYEETLELYW